MLKHFSEYLEIARELLTPKQYEERLENISLEHLRKLNKYAIYLDIDNTILPYHSRRVSFEKANWVNKAKSLGFELFLVSNNINFNRIKKIARDLDIDRGLCFALKPFSFSLREFAKKHRVNLERSVIIGDQIFTDIILGNWLKCYTILVDPVDKKLSFFKTTQREIEFSLLKKISAKK